MSQEYENLGSILCLDVPEGTKFGIDYEEWTCGPNFKGVKMIPSGIHFVYYRFVIESVSSDDFSAGAKYGGEPGPRIGFFLRVKPGDVFVRRWNSAIEDFFEENEMDNDEVERYIIAVKKFEFDRNLGKYPDSNYSEWQKLSRHVTPSVLDVLEPIAKRISGIFDSADDMKHLEEQMKNHKFSNISSDSNSSQPPKQTNMDASKFRPYYTTISKFKVVKGATAQELTKYNMDKSALLYDVIKRYSQDGGVGVLGELEFSFICFLMGQSFDGFAQWKDLCGIFCGAEEAMNKFPDLFKSFLETFQFQLAQVPTDFFDDIITSNNFLFAALKNLFEILSDDNIEPQLKRAGEKLQLYVNQRFNLKFDMTGKSQPTFDEYDEDAPVIVDLDDQ